MLRALLLITLALAGPLSAGAVPVASVRSAVGEADARNASGSEAWMPQLAANLVFRDAETTRYSAFVVSSDFDQAPFSVRVTSLRPGETRLLFADAKFSLRIRASFLSEIP